MSTELAIRSHLTDEQKELLKRTICKGATDDELALFVQTANRLGLDPFSKQIHAVKRWTKNGEVMSIQVGIDGFRLQAQRAGQYEGQIGPQWCGESGEWKDVWLYNFPPAAARVGVWRTGFREPIWAVARWESYKQESRGGLSPMWQRMPDLMLAKCAEALALRRAFPAELSGIYAPEEMAQADTDYTPPPITPIQQPQEHPAVAEPPTAKQIEPPHPPDEEATTKKMALIKELSLALDEAGVGKDAATPEIRESQRFTWASQATGRPINRTRDMLKCTLDEIQRAIELARAQREVAA